MDKTFFPILFITTCNLNFIFQPYRVCIFKIQWADSAHMAVRWKPCLILEIHAAFWPLIKLDLAVMGYMEWAREVLHATMGERLPDWLVHPTSPLPSMPVCELSEWITAAHLISLLLLSPCWFCSLNIAKERVWKAGRGRRGRQQSRDVLNADAINKSLIVKI